MKNGKFDFMGFGYSPGCNDMFVANARKYSADQTIEICKREYDYLFRDHVSAYGHKVKALREPTNLDVQDTGCAFRFGMYEWPDGCYTLVGENERGAFPVHVIDFERLKKEAQP